MTSNIRYVPFWEDDFEADTLGMKPEHKWIYWKLCVAITRSDTGWIKDDDNWIAARVGISAPRWRRSKGAIIPHLDFRTDNEKIDWLSQKRARREHAVATVKLAGNRKGGETTQGNKPKKKGNGKGKTNKNNGSTLSQPGSQLDSQPGGQPPSQLDGQPSSNRTEDNVISIKEITSVRASDDLARWVMKKTKLDQKPIPVPGHLTRMWETAFHIDDVKNAISNVVAQSSYDISKVNGLAYFVPAITELHEKRRKKLFAKVQRKVKNMEGEDWLKLIDMWLDGREWPESYGPAPDELEHFVPEDLSTEYETAIAARNAPIRAAAFGTDDGVDFDSE